MITSHRRQYVLRHSTGFYFTLHYTTVISVLNVDYNIFKTGLTIIHVFVAPVKSGSGGGAVTTTELPLCEETTAASKLFP